MVAVVLLELTLRSVLDDIPRDAGSIVAYLLMLFIIGIIVYGSRSGGGSTEGAQEPGALRSAGEADKASAGSTRKG